MNLENVKTDDVLDLYVKFIYSEKATQFCEISNLLLTGTTQDKSKVEISQNCVAFSEYMNFNIARTCQNWSADFRRMLSLCPTYLIT